jgi:hypothetical protein
MGRNEAQQCLVVQVSNPSVKEHCSFVEIFQRISTIIDDNRLPLFVTLRGQTIFFIDASTLHRSLQGKGYVITENVSTENGNLMSQLVLQRLVMSLHELLCL